MNAWISPFLSLIWEIRTEEIHWLQKVAYIKGFQFGLNFATPTILAAAVFIPFVVATDGELTERVVFTTMALFNAVRFVIGVGQALTPFRFRILSATLCSCSALVPPSQITPNPDVRGANCMCDPCNAESCRCAFRLPFSPSRRCEWSLADCGG
jgi:hypothetical protein